MKVIINQLLDCTSAPKCLWLLAALYVTFCLNQTIDVEIENGETILYTYSSGHSDNITPLLCSCFYEVVYCFQLQEKHQFLLSPKKFTVDGLVFLKMLDMK